MGRGARVVAACAMAWASACADSELSPAGIEVAVLDAAGPGDAGTASDELDEPDVAAAPDAGDDGLDA